jgi:hypothetical protein
MSDSDREAVFDAAVEYVRTNTANMDDIEANDEAWDRLQSAVAALTRPEADGRVRRRPPMSGDPRGVRCPECSAEAGEPCVVSAGIVSLRTHEPPALGRPTPLYHVERFEAVTSRDR